MFTDQDHAKGGQHMVRRHLGAWMKLQPPEDHPILVGISSVLSVKAVVHLQCTWALGVHGAPVLG